MSAAPCKPESEPDPRFSFANERTFLAWTRTALALMVAGGAVAQFAEVAGPAVRGVLAASLTGLGAVVALLGYNRFRQSEQALRTDSPLPRFRGPVYLGFGLAVVGLVAAVAMALGHLG